MKRRLLIAVSAIVCVCLWSLVIVFPVQTQTLIRATQLALSDTFAFTGNNTHGGTETFANIDAIQFVDGVTNTTVQAAINKLPAAGGAIVVPPGSYAGPAWSTMPSNVSFWCLAPPISTFPAQDIALNTTTVLDQCKFTYSATQTMTAIQNVHFYGIILDQNQSGGSFILKGSSFNSFDYVTFRQCGDTTSACVQILANGSTAPFNAVYNHFTHSWINANQASSHYAGCVLLQGQGTVNAGGSATINTFEDTTCSGNVLFGIDQELNTDTNFFHIFNIFQDFGAGLQPATTAAIWINTVTPASDQDADGTYYDGITYTGASAVPLVRAGYTRGNRIRYTNAVVSVLASGLPSITSLGGSQNIAFEAVAPGGVDTFQTGVILHMYTGAGQPSLFWDDSAGVKRIQQYLDGSNCVQFLDAPNTQNVVGVCPGTLGLFIEKSGYPITNNAGDLLLTSSFTNGNVSIQPNGTGTINVTNGILPVNTGLGLGGSFNAWGSLTLGSGSTGYKFTPATPAAARTVNISDPGATTNLGFNFSATSAAFAPGALTAGTCSTQAATTVTGTTTSMVASVSPVSDPGTGLNWLGILGSGTVAIRVCNTSTGSITPTSTAYNIRVTP